MSEEKQKRLKKYQKNIVRLKIFIDVKSELIALPKKDSYYNKGAFQNCYQKDNFY